MKGPSVFEEDIMLQKKYDEDRQIPLGHNTFDYDFVFSTNDDLVAFSWVRK